MHAISGVMQSILLQLIMFSMHIDMHIPQSSIHRHIAFISHFIRFIGILFHGVEYSPKAGQHAGSFIVEKTEYECN